MKSSSLYKTTWKKRKYNMIKWLQNLWYEYKVHRAYKKKIKELKKRDPFIYK